jgi:hypothetical protein
MYTIWHLKFAKNMLHFWLISAILLQLTERGMELKAKSKVSDQLNFTLAVSNNKSIPAIVVTRKGISDGTAQQYWVGINLGLAKSKTIPLRKKSLTRRTFSSRFFPLPPPLHYSVLWSGFTVSLPLNPDSETTILSQNHQICSIQVP